MNINIHTVKSIVREAAGIATAHAVDIRCKDGAANIVTAADELIQQFLCEKFEQLTPGCGFICEENNLVDLRDEGCVWIIDPIDGTMNYAHEIGEYCISAALMVDREIVLGVVYNPVRDHMFSAVKGDGAEMNGKALKVSSRRFEEGLLCTAMSLYRKEHAKVCSDIIYDAYMECNDVRRFGSCALEICYTAMGLCDLYFEFRVMPWDCAAASLILAEAGGILSDYNGEALRFDRPMMLIGANNEENHRKMISCVTKHINPNTCNYEWREW